MKLGVSIIVLNYNGANYLNDCLSSILNRSQEGIEYEVIVVDNGSNDGSQALVREKFPEVKLLEMGYNAGFCLANNAGAKIARFPFLFFLNNDTTVTDNLFTFLLQHFEDPEVFAVSPRIIRVYENQIDEAISVGFFKGGCINTDNKISKNITPDLSKPLPIFYTCGAAMMVDKNKFLELEGFDPLFRPFYFEDSDLCYRAWKLNWKCLYDPRGTVYHLHDKTIGNRFSKIKIKTSFRKNQYLFIWKNITDFRMLLSHFLEMLIPKILIPNIIEWGALIWAFRQLPEALRKRKWNKNAKLSDREVFAKTAYLLKYLK